MFNRSRVSVLQVEKIVETCFHNNVNIRNPTEQHSKEVKEVNFVMYFSL